jgi:hypothetical protein
MAAPLHDASPPPAREEAVAVQAADLPVPEPLVAEPPAAPSFTARAGVVGPRRVEEAVPQVIFETRRTIPVRREPTRESLRSSPADGAVRIASAPLRHPAPEPAALTAAVARADVGGSAVFTEPQSP